MKKLHKISAYLIIILGAAHLCFTPLNYNGLTLDALWFASAGFAIIFAGFLNLTLLSGEGKGRAVFAMCFISNLAFVAMFALALRLLKEPQVFVGLILFSFAAFAALMSGISKNRVD